MIYQLTMVRSGSDLTGDDTSGNDATESEETDITQEWAAQNSFFFLKPLITLNGTSSRHCQLSLIKIQLVQDK